MQLNHPHIKYFQIQLKESSFTSDKYRHSALSNISLLQLPLSRALQCVCLCVFVVKADCTIINQMSELSDCASKAHNCTSDSFSLAQIIIPRPNHHIIHYTINCQVAHEVKIYRRVTNNVHVRWNLILERKKKHISYS